MSDYSLHQWLMIIKTSSVFIFCCRTDHYSCSMCGANFDHRSAFAEHMLLHGVVVPEIKQRTVTNVKCDVCKKRFADRYSMFKHKKDTHGVKTEVKSYKKRGQGRLQCDHCDKRYQHKSHLNRHKLVSHGIPVITR